MLRTFKHARIQIHVSFTLPPKHWNHDAEIIYDDCDIINLYRQVFRNARTDRVIYDLLL